MMSCDDMCYDVILMTSHDGMMSCYAMSDVMYPYGAMSYDVMSYI